MRVSVEPKFTKFFMPGYSYQTCEVYPTSSIDTLMIHTQLSSAKSFIQSLDKSATLLTIHEVRTCLNRLPHDFRELLKVIDLVLTLPMTSVENERFFSCMKRVKNISQKPMWRYVTQWFARNCMPPRRCKKCQHWCSYWWFRSFEKKKISFVLK